MPRPSQIAEKRRALIPAVARAFVERGYRRATTAELARRCRVRENILYRLWPDKKAMFIAAIEYVYELSEATWTRVLRDTGNGRPAAERLLAYESRHQGEFGHYRLVFAGLGEADDPDIRAALTRTYRRFARFLEGQIISFRDGGSRPRGAARTSPAPELAAWAIIGLGTAANIARELDLMDGRRRARLIAQAGRMLLNGRVS